MNEIESHEGVIAWIDSEDQRRLTSVTDYVIQLYFELQYVSEDAANIIESADGSHQLRSHLCYSVRQQVRFQTMTMDCV